MAFYTINELINYQWFVHCVTKQSRIYQKFRRQFPNIPETSSTFVYRMRRRVKTTGSFQPRPTPGRNCSYTEYQETDITAFFCHPTKKFLSSKQYFGTTKYINC